MPSEGTDRHSFRIEPALWERCVAKAAAEGESVSAVVRRALEEYARSGA